MDLKGLAPMWFFCRAWDSRPNPLSDTAPSCGFLYGMLLALSPGQGLMETSYITASPSPAAHIKNHHWHFIAASTRSLRHFAIYIFSVLINHINHFELIYDNSHLGAIKMSVCDKMSNWWFLHCLQQRWQPSGALRACINIYHGARWGLLARLCPRHFGSVHTTAHYPNVSLWIVPV